MGCNNLTPTRFAGRGRGWGLGGQDGAGGQDPTPAPHDVGRGENKLSPDEELIFENAPSLILKELQEELDAAVAATYGWPVDLLEEQVPARLVALNKERAAEEAKGFVRWLRPEYQIPCFGFDAEKKQFEAFDDVEQKPAAAAKLAQSFKQGKKCEARVLATLASLMRTGFISASKDATAFAIRRAG